MFDTIRSDPLVSTFGVQATGMALLGYARGGNCIIQSGSTETVIDSSRGGLILIDCDKPTLWTSDVNDVSYLALPKSLIRTAVGFEVFSRREAVIRLPDDGLTPVLRSHLDQMTTYSAKLSAPEASAALIAAGSLACGLLAALHGSHPADETVAHDAIFNAAMRQIDLHLHDPDLTADRIATALRCSRAHLYRIFSGRNESIGRALRAARLRRAYALLKGRTTETIGLIAFRCGYTDLSAFGKAFKRHFGVTPGEITDRTGIEPETRA